MPVLPRRSGAMKNTITLFAAALLLVAATPAFGREARLVRYPHYHNGRVVFTYLGDIWTADENGQNVQRLTVNRARDVYGRFSPDGKWIAFSSDRNGNMDVFLIPAGGGQAKQLTNHSSDDTVLGWSADGRSVLFVANRGEDFTAATLSRQHRGRHAVESRHRHGRAGVVFTGWTKARLQPEGAGLLAQVLPRLYAERHHGDGRRREEVYATDRFRRPRFMAHVESRWFHLLRERSRGQWAHQHLARLGKRRQSGSRHELQNRRRALARDQHRWPRDRFRARLRHLETRRCFEDAQRRSR